jgi:hypothetical protein
MFILFYLICDPQVSFHYSETTSTTSTTRQSYSQLPLIYLERTRPLISSFKKLTQPQHRTLPDQPRERVLIWFVPPQHRHNIPTNPTYLPTYTIAALDPLLQFTTSRLTLPAGEKIHDSPRASPQTTAQPLNNAPATPRRHTNARRAAQRAPLRPARGSMRLYCTTPLAPGAPSCFPSCFPSLFRAPRSRGAANIRGVV